MLKNALAAWAKTLAALVVATFSLSAPVMAEPEVSFSNKVRLGWEVWFRDVIDGHLHTILRRGPAANGLEGADFYYCVFQSGGDNTGIAPLVECSVLGEK